MGTKFVIEFLEHETTPDHIKALASELDITPEQWIHRAIAKALGGYGITPVPDQLSPKNLNGLFLASGVFKPPPK